MKILAIDTSSKICSVSILEDTNVLIEKHSDDEKTHSQKLMPIIDSVFKEVNLSLDNIDLLACSQGPGSFTGIRIGISTVKAFSDVKHIPVIGVTSLESLAYNIKTGGLVATLIDAKHDNVYFALFELKAGNCTTIIEPVSDCITNVVSQLKEYSCKITFIGDGSVVHKELLQKDFQNCDFATDVENLQTSISIGKSAFNKYNSKNYEPSYTLSPIYLKKSQAEINLENSKINNTVN
ncbi:MAG: tRNA (adenosine(37)-N6)-threonylcarbamoyltransferase complex dimerization subunit type 1 TsaB [Clostridia bacterium]|nr:tRNA (adenosine(37)-N6)-threonylcarbamoyltransferase complex dimerization subunit type 1 TsaB [Clostridia bacterium]